MISINSLCGLMDSFRLHAAMFSTKFIYHISDYNRSKWQIPGQIQKTEFEWQLREFPSLDASKMTKNK